MRILESWPLIVKDVCEGCVRICHGQLTRHTNILRKAEGRRKEGDSTFNDLVRPSEDTIWMLVVQWRVYDLQFSFRKWANIHDRKQYVYVSPSCQ